MRQVGVSDPLLSNLVRLLLDRNRLVYLPDEAGEMPEYDVQPADIDVNADTTTVITPDVDITTPPDTTPTN